MPKNILARLISIAVLVLLTIPAPAQADPSADLSADVVNVLYSMKSVYSSEYAPAAWKKQYAGYDLNTEFGNAIKAVQANPKLTTNDARTIFKNFIYAMKDYHTSISFVSTETATLPLSIRGAGNRYFIVSINRTILTTAAFTFSVGDELVSVAGQPIATAVSNLEAEIPANVPETDKALAEYRFFSRTGARGLNVPSGPVTLGIRRKGETAVSFTQMIWTYTPELITPRTSTFSLQSMIAALGSKAPSVFHPMMSVKLADNDPSTASPYDIGARTSYIPALGTKTWESPSNVEFDAYIFKTAEGKSVGYVRIPQYESTDYGKAVSDFATIIQKFQSSTDSMIIDQIDNPGGSVFYLYALASMLTDQPLTTPRHRMAITQTDVNDALTSIQTLSAVKNDADAQKAVSPNDLNGYPSSYEFVQFTLSYAKFIVSEWNAGRHLTTPYWIGGVDHINPNPIHYSKPILLLINHLDFSGGDFFPSIMQDNKRVTVFGSRTAGAGGYVNDVAFPNNVGIAGFRVTESIAERVSGNPIENLGVTPDVAYELTPDDFMGGYAPYVKAILDALKTITP
jgi:hypothetical protein